MKDDVQKSRRSASRVEDDDVSRLAHQAIGMLAAGTERGGARQKDRLYALSNACISSNGEDRHEALALLRAAGMSVDDVIDKIIPAVACVMGERWFADEISFADVTIGTARLQEAVHALSYRDTRHKTALPTSISAPRLLLVLPRGEDHSLGLFVLADQMRRRGYSVDLAVDENSTKIGQLVRQRRYAMVGISVSGRRTLASARDITEKIKTMATYVLPVVIGGCDGVADKVILESTGVDHVARSAADALKACGLSLSLTTGTATDKGRPLSETAVGKGDDR